MKKPIHRAIASVLRATGKPLTPQEIYEEVERRRLYSFKARAPLQVVKSQLRRHTKELDFPSAHAAKYFTMTNEGRFALLARPIKVPPSLFRVPSKNRGKAGTVVSVPSDAEERDQELSIPDGPSHSEMQWRLLDIGAKMGLSLWAPHGDRGKTWNGRLIGSVPKLVSRLPIHFNEATMTTIENIDVLWLERDAIIAGFEVEHTSQIYSGLLRMSDLITLQPNIEIKLYVVGPDSRFGKFAREVARSTFSSLRKPLHTLCRFLPYGSLLERLDEAKNLVHHLRPAFLDDVAERYDPDAESSSRDQAGS